MPILVCPIWMLADVLSTLSDGFDQFADYVTLLMHMNGNDNGTVFRDERNHAVSLVGTPVTSTTQSKFGSASAKFNGTTDYLTLPLHSGFVLGAAGGSGSGDFTIEAWVYANATPVSRDIMGNAHSNDNNATWRLATDASAKLRFTGWTTNWLTSTNALVAGQWNHVAISRIGTTTRMFLNGALEASTTTAITLTGSTSALWIGYDTVGFWNGYIDDVRITKGVGRYSAAFTVPALAFADYFSNADYDPYFSQVVALNHFEGTSGDNSFSDATGRTMTLVGAPVLSSIQKMFGSTSARFDGASNLNYSSSQDFNLGTKDYTIECWVHPTSYVNVNMFLSMGSPTSGDTGIGLYITNTGLITAASGSTAVGNSGSTTAPLNTWTHVALTRSGTSTQIWINGTVVSTFANSFNISDAILCVGGNSPYFFNGYIDEVRVTREIARYTSAFSPVRNRFGDKSTSQVSSAFDPYWQNVKAVFAFDGTDNSTVFTDSAATAHTVTTAGTPVLKTATKKFGTASLYLEGTSSYLKMATTADFQFAALDFTVEGWINPTVVTAGKIQAIAAFWNESVATQCGWQLRLNGNALEFKYGSGSTITLMSGTGAVAAGQFSHVAVVRRNGWIHLFLNGVKIASSFVNTTSLNTSTLECGIGGQSGLTAGQLFGGYIDDFRVTNGVGRYSSSFVPNEWASPAVTNQGYNARFPSDTFAAQTMCYVGFDDLVPVDLMGHSLTVLSGLTISTQSYQNNGAGVFGGSTSAIRMVPSTDFAPGTGDFTIEAWVNSTAALTYSNDSANHAGLIWSQTTNGSNYLMFYLTSDNVTLSPGFLLGGTLTVTGPALVSGAWNHVAVVRKNGTITVYTNGVPGTPASGTLDINNTSYTPTIGQYSHNTSQLMFGGSMDSFRYTKAARYLAAFDPKTAM